MSDSEQSKPLLPIVAGNLAIRTFILEPGDMGADTQLLEAVDGLQAVMVFATTRKVYIDAPQNPKTAAAMGFAVQMDIDALRKLVANLSEIGKRMKALRGKEPGAT
jgi:hypothetical protein